MIWLASTVMNLCPNTVKFVGMHNLWNQHINKPIYSPILKMHDYMFNCFIFFAFSIVFPCNLLVDNHCYIPDNMLDVLVLQRRLVLLLAQLCLKCFEVQIHCVSDLKHRFTMQWCKWNVFVAVGWPSCRFVYSQAFHSKTIFSMSAFLYGLIGLFIS